MGNNCNKPNVELEGDAFYMHQRDPDNTTHLKKWEKRYGFSGKLKIPQLVELCTRVTTKAINSKNKKTKEKYYQELTVAERWLEAAKTRAREREHKRLVKQECSGKIYWPKISRTKGLTDLDKQGRISIPLSCLSFSHASHFLWNTSLYKFWLVWVCSQFHFEHLCCCRLCRDHY